MSNSIRILNVDAAVPVQMQITKVDLHFLDGTMQEMKLMYPRFTNWSEAAEITNNYLEGLIGYWCKHWLKIKAYQVHLGHVNPDGSETYWVHYAVDKIPLDKVFQVYDPKGRWVSPQEEKQRLKDARLAWLNDRSKPEPHLNRIVPWH